MLLDDGVSYAQTAHATGCSPQAVARYAISRKTELAKLIDGDLAVTDVAARLIEAADDARELRRQSRQVGTPVARARAIKAETDVIAKLLRELDVSDTALADGLDEVFALAATLKTFVQTKPEHARPLIDLLLKSSSPDVGEALNRVLPGDSNDN